MNVIIETIRDADTSTLIFASYSYDRSAMDKSKTRKVFYEILRLSRKKIKR